MAKVQIEIDANMKRNFQRICFENRITMSDAIRKLVEDYIHQEQLKAEKSSLDVNPWK